MTTLKVNICQYAATVAVTVVPPWLPTPAAAAAATAAAAAAACAAAVLDPAPAPAAKAAGLLQEQCYMYQNTINKCLCRLLHMILRYVYSVFSPRPLLITP